MRFKLISTIFLLYSLPISATENEQLKKINSSIEQCRNISSILERLDCYDNIQVNIDTHVLMQMPKNPLGIVWQRAQNQEKMRDNKNTHFIRTEEDEPPSVVLTTPALGYTSQRPILMLSCIDNITRFQVVSHTSFGKRASLGVRLITGKTQLDGQWFLRENGLVLEASRGLDGIKEIQQLFNAEQLTIKIESDVIKELVFNIDKLSEEIKPLRAMCHW